MDMLMLETVPESLAVWCEGCVCHDRFVRHGDDQPMRQRHSVGKAEAIHAHYGPHRHTCPMAGKRAPELAAGALLQYFTALWSNKVAALLSVNGDATALTPAESTQILEDLDAGRANMHLQLQSKLDFWSRLPWLLAGLAHTDEGKARLCASNALSSFDLDARESAHHRITWALLRPGKFRAAIDSVVAGAPRFSMPDYVLNVIASFRFIPVVETTIEGKHAKVALESPGFLGAVRVSLSNRFQVVERCLS